MSNPINSHSPTFSEIASFLRVPLIVLVVCIHALGSESASIDLSQISHAPSQFIYTYVTEFISHSLARVAVPLFFFISGYYTFFRTDWSDRSMCFLVWKKKVHSLVLPYLLWNSLYLCLLLSKTAISEYLGLGLNDSFSIPDIQTFFSFFSTQVIDYPLWYIRELIILTLLSPIIYIGIRRFPLYSIVTCLSIFLSGISIIPNILSTTSLLFFIGGGY